MRRIVTLAMVVAFCAVLGACGSSVRMSPKAERRAAIIAAALAQKSVHWTVDDYELNDGEWKVSADVNSDSGTARVNWREGGEGGWYRLVHVNRMFYVRTGDAGSLRQAFNLTKAQATRYAGRWISTPNGTGLTFWLGDGLTLPVIVREYASAVRPEAGARRIGERLPVGFDKNPSPVAEISGTFSQWNEPVHVHAPANSTPIATVRGG